VAPHREPIWGLSRIAWAAYVERRIRRRVATLFAALLMLAAPAIATAPPSPAPAVPDEAAELSYLKIRISERSVLLRLHLAYPANNGEVEAVLDDNDASARACGALGDLTINVDHKVCDLFNVADGQQPRRRISRTGDIVHVDIQRLVRRREFAPDLFYMQFCTDGGGRLSVVDRLIVEAQDGLYVRAVRPVPLVLDENKASMTGISERCSMRSPRLALGLDPPNLEPTDESEGNGPISLGGLCREISGKEATIRARWRSRFRECRRSGLKAANWAPSNHAPV